MSDPGIEPQAGGAAGRALIDRLLLRLRMAPGDDLGAARPRVG
jgi:hypothetical protein